MQCLFVYGSLAPGRSHHHLLGQVPGRWQPASCTGFLLPAGYGRTRGWPAFKPDPAGKEIDGFLLTSRLLFRRWQVLDRFEGVAYRRVRRKVRLEDGSRVSAWLYCQKGLPRTVLDTKPKRRRMNVIDWRARHHLTLR